MADPNHYRFNQIRRGMAQRRYYFVPDRFLHVLSFLSGAISIPAFSSYGSLIRLTRFAPRPASLGFLERHRKVKGLTQFRVSIQLLKFLSVQSILLSHQLISRRLGDRKSLLGLPNWISLQQYVLVAGDTS